MPELPPRYEPIAQLGKGGGGEVWSVRDRATSAVVALKTLAAGEGEGEAAALVHEAVALSGLEGLGVPRVLRFGRLASGRPYLVRDLVPGKSLASMLETSVEAKLALSAVARVAEQLTRLHRAQLLHGDVKPANIIVGESGRATLVDLGLAAAFREGGTRPLGLTPRYAAPELFEGAGLTVRAEVYALGATLSDALEAARPAMDPAAAAALDLVVRRATSTRPEARYPSVDELASALGQLLQTGPAPVESRPLWPVIGLDDAAHALLSRLDKLGPGGGIVVTGPAWSGRSTLMQRLAWSLGLAGKSVAWIQCAEVASPAVALELELGDERGEGLTVVVDDCDRLDEPTARRIAELRSAGARLVVTGATGDRVPGRTLEVFEVPRLDGPSGRELLLRAAPTLGESAALHVLARADHWPGRVRAIVDRLHGAPVVSIEDIDARIPEGMFEDAFAPDGAGAPLSSRWIGPASISAIREALERGHFEEGAELLSTRQTERSLELSVLRARLLLNRGEWRESLAELASVEDAVSSGAEEEIAEYENELGRAHLRAGDNASSERAAEEVFSRFGERTATLSQATVTTAAERRLVVATCEALSVGGVAKCFLGKQDEALSYLGRAITLAERLGVDRALSLAFGSLGFVHQRAGSLDLARGAYVRALRHAEAAGDAGTVATTRLNLAALAKASGGLSEALGHLEAAVDMGHRSGRRATLRQALLNLANLDLYLGRLARAEASIEKLAEVRAELPPQMAAQLIALEAEAAMKSGAPARAEAKCLECATAYDSLGRSVDGAEARLESIFAALAVRSGEAIDAATLRARLKEAEDRLVGVTSHGAALELARAKILARTGEPEAALAAFDAAVTAAEASGKKDWLVRAYQARAELRTEEGQRLAARRDREAALALLEEIAEKLPRDLREVYWDEPSRRAVREVDASLHGGPAPQAPTVHLSQDRLARVLEINAEIAGTYDLKRLLERVTDHAISLLSAERGFVILKSASAEGQLSIHASRDQAGDDPHARFSQSIAERVIRVGEPIVTSSARDDARMADYVSVHQLLLQSVACVPIRSRSSGVIGALYVETRHRALSSFSEELPLVLALADQVAIAIETARLVSENDRRARELERANAELAVAKTKLEELLGHRTAQLAQTRKDLRSARAVLKSHFGYEGLVGTSDAMRRLYALIDRVKDTDVPVLISGESGTGKEIIARAIHNSGARARKPFLGINCGAIPEHLLESELFGHVRGAFTGADRDRRGLFREATDGTILLDEIGEMPQKMQAGLLRVLQEKVVRPVGGPREEPIDTRVIAATHRDLESMVAEGRFREDLFYRLNVIQVRVPSLRERLDDIPMLIDHFLGIFAARYGRERRSVSRAALKMLTSYRWPGNVRQLENALLNAWVLSDEPELEPDDFEIGEIVAAPRAAGGQSSAPGPRGVATSLDAHRTTEKDRMLEALSSCNWNRVRAAELVGMPRRTFYRRLREYGIQ